MTLSVQVATLFSMIGAGMGMAWAYDLYTWARRMIRPHPFVTFIFDLFYWILFAFLVFLVLTKVNAGKIRFTLFIALLFGGMVYFRFFSEPFLKLWEILVNGMLRIVRAILHILYNLFYRPIRWILLSVLAIMTTIGLGIWTLIQKIGKLALALVSRLGKIITRIGKKTKDE
jgi:spore cortex biosynthesis protein YabQ